MLVYLNEDKEIIAYNCVLTKEEAVEFVNDNCIWVDNLKIDETKNKDGCDTKMYLIDGEIIYKFVPMEIPKPTQLDRIEEAISRTQEEIKQEAIDNYTIQLMEEGLI